MDSGQGFGRRVKRMRETRGFAKQDLANLVPGFTRQRVTMVEGGQLHASDLSEEQKARLAEVLRCSLDWLVSGLESTSEQLPAGVLAMRSDRMPVQGHLDLMAQECPDCHQSLHGSRCNYCGRSPGL